MGGLTEFFYLVDRLLRMDMSSLLSDNWWLYFLLLTTAENLITLELWWVWMRPLCVPFRWRFFFTVKSMGLVKQSCFEIWFFCSWRVIVQPPWPSFFFKFFQHVIVQFFLLIMQLVNSLPFSFSTHFIFPSLSYMPFLGLLDHKTHKWKCSNFHFYYDPLTWNQQC